jgi:DNA-binding SARP family transcriptional activator
MSPSAFRIGAGWHQLDDARKRLQREDLTVLPALERAYESLRAAREGDGQLLTAAYGVQAIAAAYADFRHAERWVGRLQDVQAATARLSPPERLVVCAAIVSAAVIVDTAAFDSPVIAEAVEQGLRILHDDAATLPAADALAAARALLEYAEQQGHADTFHRVVVAAARCEARASGARLVTGRYWVYRARCSFRLHAYDAARNADLEAVALLARAEALADEAGLPLLHFDVRYARVQLATIRSDTESLPKLVEALHEVLDYERPNCVAVYQQHLARVHLMQDRVAQAFEAAGHALRAAQLAACASGELRGNRIMYALVLLAAGQGARSVAEIEDLLGNVSGRPRAILECTLRFARAWQARQGGAPEYPVLLEHAMRQAEELNWPLFLNSLPRIAGQLAADALRFEMAQELAHRAIALRRLPPPPEVDDRWPWPVCIYALGPLRISIDDQSLEFTGKAQRKPLELLELALCRGGDIEAGHAAAELWPDLEGPQSRNAFDLALHRLRKLLRHPEAVNLQNGHVVLDRARVWIDVSAFERVCAEIDAIDEDRSPATPGFATLASRLLRLYAGEFLAGEDAHWALPMRERLRSRLLRVLEMLGAMLERQDRVDEAIALYRRAIEVDPLAESFHCRLMVCYRGQARIAEALDAYRHCRELLSVTLGIQPSAATQSVYRSLKEG